MEEGTYDALDDPSEEEEDMLDQAWGLTPTSRLGCQVELTEEMDGIKVRILCSIALALAYVCAPAFAWEVRRRRVDEWLADYRPPPPHTMDTQITLPRATRNLYVDGHVPKPVRPLCVLLCLPSVFQPPTEASMQTAPTHQHSTQTPALIPPMQH